MYHGASVETCAAWFCEAVWDDDFDSGSFDATDIVAGSGGRRRDDRLVFVSSGSTVDRLVSFESDRELCVSNSLPALLKFLNAEVDATYLHYFDDFYSIVEGVDAYRRGLETSKGTVSLTYFRNLEWNDGVLAVIDKPERASDMSNFESYREFLRGCMKRIAENAGDASRVRPYRLLSTLSSGYDSTTITTLARDSGCREALTFDKDFRGSPDSGEEVAAVLGIETIRVGDSDWRAYDMPEVPFLAANAMGEEVRFKGAETSLGGRVLLTGYHGDKVWSKDTKSLGPEIIRGDPSGLGLAEFRLWAGFIHCPAAFWGVRRIKELHAISNAPQMKPWDVAGDYSRPICRRLCEDAGVPRELFGRSKRNASVILHNYDEFLTTDSRADYFQWLCENSYRWWAKGRVPPVRSAVWDRVAFVGTRAIASLLKRLPILWRWSGHLETGPVSARRFVFAWALERAKGRYCDD